MGDGARPVRHDRGHEERSAQPESAVLSTLSVRSVAYDGNKVVLAPWRLATLDLSRPWQAHKGGFRFRALFMSGTSTAAGQIRPTYGAH